MTNAADTKNIIIVCILCGLAWWTTQWRPPPLHPIEIPFVMQTPTAR